MRFRSDINHKKAQGKYFIMNHPSLYQWQLSLRRLLNRLDDVLEAKFGHLYPLHPARPAHGQTAVKAHDGLFQIHAHFSTGIGSKHGRGYVIDIHLATLEHVTDDVRAEVEQFAMDTINQMLPDFFPNRDLQASKDGSVIKITGNFHLGKAY